MTIYTRDTQLTWYTNTRVGGNETNKLSHLHVDISANTVLISQPVVFYREGGTTRIEESGSFAKPVVKELSVWVTALPITLTPSPPNISNTHTTMQSVLPFVSALTPTVTILSHNVISAAPSTPKQDFL